MSKPSDRELLELAAKAVGVCLHPADKLRHSYGNWGCDTTCTVCGKEPSSARWSSLTDDGDALRLAVKLGIDIHFRSTGTYTNTESLQDEFFEANNSDPYAATRRAITRAAAEIGKNLQ